MPETKDRQPAELWETLSDPERGACIYFAVSDWKTGVGKDYLGAMGIEDKSLGELVKRGVVETKPTWRFFQDLADQLKDKAEAIKTRIHEDPLNRLEDDERQVLQDYDRYKMVADRKNEEPRYHLTNLDFHNYINETEGVSNLDNQEEERSSIVPKEKVGVQERPHEFGAGETKRVYEVLYKSFSFGVNCGDIAQVPTEAVMCPTSPWLEVAGGAIENRLAEEIGETLFEDYAHKLMNIVGKVLTTEGNARLEAASELQKLLREKGGMKVEATPEQVADEISSSCEMQDLDGVGKHSALFYGAAIPAPSGRLSEGGIKLVVLTNVTPDGSKTGQERGMTKEHMEDFTYNACKAANLVGVQSITIPAVGTGFAAAFGFGLSRQDSMAGFLAGAKRFADEFGGNALLKQVDYNIYAQPNAENAKQVAKLVADSGAKNLLV